jgi:hypothetical protein
MNTCETFQAQLLNHVYGLLDEEERQALAEHLPGCAACRAALALAEQQRKMLAVAAKGDFSQVQFQPPAEAPGAPEPRRVAAPRPAPTLPVWSRWAIAAGLLLTVGVAGGWTWTGYRKVDERARQARLDQEKWEGQKKSFEQERQKAQARTAQRIREIQDEIQRLDTRRKKSRLQVRITGPQTIEAGARNQFLVHTENLLNEPVQARVSIRVRRQQNQQVVYERQDLRSRGGQCQVVLPPDLKQPPGTRLNLEVVARGDNGGEVQVDARNLHLVAPLYLTHLTTDKPMYQPGEVVYFRSLTLERFSLRPVDRDLPLVFQVTDPNGGLVFTAAGPSRLRHGPEKGNAPVLGPDNQPVRGIGAGSYAIPETAAGGVYTLTLTEAGNPYPLQQRTFLVNRYEKPRLNKQLEFTRKSYGPGAEVVAACRVERAEGLKPLSNQEVRATVQVDGKVHDASGKAVNGADSGIVLRTDARGAVSVRFKLPVKIERGEASLAVSFTDGGSHETVVRPIPIVLKKLRVEFFPEGGDLVAGVRNRIYFQVRTLLGKPAELKGLVVDAAGKTLAAIETLHDDKEPGANQGMGVFELAKPEAGQKYQLRIDSPEGIEGTYELPEVKPDGVVLHIPSGVIREEIAVTLRNGKTKRRLLVGAYCRGRLLDHTEVNAEANQEVKVALKPAASVGGVYRVTVFEELPRGNPRLRPVAERLIFRQPAGRVHLAIKPDKAHYTPGERVRLGLASTDEKKQSLPAILVVAVVDKSVITLADDKTARGMPTHFYLTTEVRSPEQLEHADFLLTNHPKAEQAVDLLLGTQGWRRFAEQQDPKAFQKKEKRDAERLLLVSGRTLREKGKFAQPEKGARDEFEPKMSALGKQGDELINAQARADRERLSKIASVQAPLLESRRAAVAAQAEVDDYVRSARTVGLLVLGMLLGFGGIGVLMLGLARVSQQQKRGVPYFVAGLCSLMLCVVVAGLVLNYHFNDPGRAPQAMAARGEQERLLGDKLAELPAQMQVPRMAPQEDEDGGPMPEGRAGNRPAEAKADDAQDQEKGKKAMPAGPRMELKKAAREVQRGALRAPNGAIPQPPMKRDGVGLARAKGGGVARDKELQNRFRDLRPAPMNAARRRMALGGARKQEQAGKDMDRAPAFGGQPFVVREYAHGPVVRQGNVRTDFSETLYWHPVLVLPGGKGEVAFHLCDSVTTFQVLAYAHTLDGRLGTGKAEVQSRLPFTLEPKVPIEVTASDKITIPLAIRNATDQKRAVNIQVEANGLKNLGPADARLDVDAEKTVRRLFRFQPALVEGRASMLFKGQCEPFAQDSIERKFQVVPEGFPIVASQSGLLERSASHTVTLPATWLKGTLKLKVEVYPSTLADLQKGLEGLLREPYGCFEQSSTTNYPNVLILDYLKESDQTNPDLVRRVRDLLDRGYQRLTSFECFAQDRKKKGYEWFGGTAPPHEALTAYGLLQFRDMARVYPVDKAMLERTRKYLMEQKDGQGGFKRNPRALDTFGAAPPHITNAYIVWALTEGGKDDVEKELTALANQAKTSKDPYFLALVANSLFNRSKTAEALAVARTLAKAQKEDGHLDGAETSVTRSGGRDFQIETTALTVLAWLKANRPEFTTNLRGAVKWIGQQRGGFGGFGSTQSTILALKALIAFTKANKKTAEAGELVLFVNDREIERKAFPAGAQDVLTLTSLRPEVALNPGKNKVRVEITGKNVFPYTLSWSYQTLQPANAPNCPVELTTKLDRAAATEAETVRLSATVENKTGKGQGMAVAILGLPGGLTLPEDMKQLKGLIRPRDKTLKAGEAGSYISAFETRGRELILYWRDLAPGEKIAVTLDLICRVPGEYSGPASRAYLYYNADHKFWYQPLAVTIKPREEK